MTMPYQRTVVAPTRDLVGRMHALITYLTHDFLGGPRPLKFVWVINFQKGGTFVFYALLLAIYHNAVPAAWIYVAMQGTYGLVWLLKANAFPMTPGRSG